MISDQLIEATAAKKYLSLVLDAGSHKRLLQWWRDKVGVPLLSKVRAHHMTIEFDVEDGKAGKGSATVVGWAADDKTQVVKVSSSVKTKLTPHITVATKPEVRAFLSNKLLAKGVTKLAGPTLTGTIRLLSD